MNVSGAGEFDSTDRSPVGNNSIRHDLRAMKEAKEKVIKVPTIAYRLIVATVGPTASIGQGILISH